MPSPFVDRPESKSVAVDGGESFVRQCGDLTTSRRGTRNYASSDAINVRRAGKFHARARNEVPPNPCILFHFLACNGARSVSMIGRGCSGIKSGSRGFERSCHDAITMSRSSLALDNLRAVVILIVLAFHSVLAYVQSIPPRTAGFDDPPYQWRSFPILDSHRWFGFDLFCAWQDVYLMSLMFLLSGLFVWPSLSRKRNWRFVRDRLLRLGVPYRIWHHRPGPDGDLSGVSRLGDKPERARLFRSLFGAAVRAQRTTVVPVATPRAECHRGRH